MNIPEILMDEIEYSIPTVSDDELRIITKLHGGAEKDKFLIKRPRIDDE